MVFCLAKRVTKITPLAKPKWCGFHESNMDLRRKTRRSAAELNPHKTKSPSGIWSVDDFAKMDPDEGNVR